MLRRLLIALRSFLCRSNFLYWRLDMLSFPFKVLFTQSHKHLIKLTPAPFIIAFLIWDVAWASVLNISASFRKRLMFVERLCVCPSSSKWHTYYDRNSGRVRYEGPVQPEGEGDVWYSPYFYSDLLSRWVSYDVGEIRLSQALSWTVVYPPLREPTAVL